MKVLKYSLGVILSGFILSGCSSSIYPVTFDSNPRGATLICDGKNFGYTPITLYKEKEKLTDLENLPISCIARWNSGISKEYPSYIPLKQYPNGASGTVERGYSEGYTQDAQFALQVEQMKAQQLQAQAAQMSAQAQQQANFNQQMQNINNNLQMQQQNYQMQNLNNNLNNINNNLRNNYNGGYYNGGGYYNNR